MRTPIPDELAYLRDAEGARLVAAIGRPVTNAYNEVCAIEIVGEDRVLLGFLRGRFELRREELDALRGAWRACRDQVA